ncbi:tryptophan dimethylallyltransferase-domain-containing protein [Aspergillus desertorum]
MTSISTGNPLETSPTPLPSKGKPDPKPTTTTTQPFAVLTSYLPFTNNAQEQWWLDSGSFISSSSFHRHLLPFFGAYLPTWFSIVNRQGLAIEYSLNFQESGNPVIRSAFEPLSYASGKDAADPVNKRPAEELLAGLEKQGLEGFDLALFNHVRETIFISDEQMAALKDTEAAMHPRWRSLATGVSVATLIRKSLERLKGQLDCAAAFRLVDEYMEASGSWDLRTSIAWDCVPLRRTRLKIYGITNEVSLAKVEELWTMGGQLKDETAHEGLTLLRRLWELLEISKDDRLFSKGNEEKLEYGPTLESFSPLICNYEIHPVALAISRFFGSLGSAWEKKADGYVDLLRAC